jgi:hypothetical protein
MTREKQYKQLMMIMNNEPYQNFIYFTNGIYTLIEER